MGILEKIGKLMSGLATKQMQNVQTDWAKNLTIEQIEEYERQGLDMSEYRKIHADEAEKQKRLAEDSEAAIDLSKLDAHKTGTIDSAFANEVSRFNHTLEKKMEKAVLVYGCVVQAHSLLWEPQKKDDSSVALVLVFALDDAHRFDIEWLQRKAGEIKAMKDGAPVPADCRKFIETLQDDSSLFCFQLGESVSEGADAWCATCMNISEQSKQLPLGYIPYNRIIPFFLMEKPVNKRLVDMQLIPPACYMK
jgi:hypothetical protein